jgi:cytochrome c oxidase subunit 4
MSHPVLTPKTYGVIFVALLALTGFTVLLSDVPLGSFHIPVALAIAVTKTTLVVLFFMHGLYSPRLIWVILAGGVLFLGIMLGGTLSDYMTRHGGWLPEAGVPPPPAQSAPAGSAHR